MAFCQICILWLYWSSSNQNLIFFFLENTLNALFYYFITFAAWKIIFTYSSKITHPSGTSREQLTPLRGAPETRHERLTNLRGHDTDDWRPSGDKMRTNVTTVASPVGGSMSPSSFSLSVDEGSWLDEEGRVFIFWHQDENRSLSRCLTKK